MTQFSDMSIEEVRQYAKEQDANILLSDLIDIFHFDKAKLPVATIYPRHFEAIRSELSKRLQDTRQG